MGSRFLLFGWLSLLSVTATAQKVLAKLKDVKLQDKITTISVDRLGGFYTVSDCAIQQFDSLAVLRETYKYPGGCNKTEILEAWPLMRVYAYQNYKQQFTIFTSHLEEIDKLDIDPSFAVEPQLATPSTDLRHYWIIDLDNSIKRVSTNSNTVDIETDELKSVSGKFIYLREYQNLLFILHEKLGIYVINKLGKHIFTIPAEQINYFSFSGEDLYFLKGSQIHFFDIFTKDSYSVTIPNGFKFSIATEDRLILIRDTKAEIYGFIPKK